MLSFAASVPSPHAEGLVAQVVPALAHVVQASLEQSSVLRVPQRGHNPLPVLIQGVIQLCVVVNLCLEVLLTHTHTHTHTHTALKSVYEARAVNSVEGHTSFSW